VRSACAALQDIACTVMNTSTSVEQLLHVLLDA
jgi:hypothetical protein